MLFMESYLCYCSVRLGVIVVAVLSVILNLTLSILFFVRNVYIFDDLIDLLQHDSQYKNSNMVRRAIDWVEHSPNGVIIFLQIMCFAHIAAALLGILGALKLYKWVLLPLAFFEFIYFLGFTILHIMLMIMLKKQINLGLLIVFTLLGSFYCLFAGYNCVTCIAMFQVITLVKSPKYRQLYGEDPFNPIVPQDSWAKSRDNVQQVRVLDSPDNRNIDEEKRLAKLGLVPRREPQVISVIPVAQPASNLKWWQVQALDAEGDDNLANSTIRRNWQRDELLLGVGGNSERKNALNRQYAQDQYHRWN